MERQYTPREKIANWLHYHVWHLVAAAFVIIVLFGVLRNKAALNRDGYDYYFAYVGAAAIEEDNARLLENALASLGADVNGDGAVTVRLNQFISGNDVTNEDAVYGNAAGVAMLADITEGESYFFLLEDPETFQLEFQLLALPDGSPSAEDDFGAWDKVCSWKDCPALTGLQAQLGKDADFLALLDRLYLGRRCFVNPDMASNSPENAELWHILTDQ